MYNDPNGPEPGRDRFGWPLPDNDEPDLPELDTGAGASGSRSVGKSNPDERLLERLQPPAEILQHVRKEGAPPQPPHDAETIARRRANTYMGWNRWPDKRCFITPWPPGVEGNEAAEIAHVSDKLGQYRAEPGSAIALYRASATVESLDERERQFWHGKTPAERELEARRSLEMRERTQQWADRMLRSEVSPTPEPGKPQKPEVNSLWHWIAPMIVGFFIGVVCWAIDDPSVWTKAVGVTVACIGLAWTLGTCPWIKPKAGRIIVAGCVLVVVNPALLWRVFASYKPPLMYLNTAGISVPEPDANLIGLPNDGGVNDAIEKALVIPAGYRIAPEKAALKVEVTNDEATAWKDFALTVKVHYEMRPYLPTNHDWSRLQNIEQDVILRNCASQLACHEPIAPGHALTLVFVNHSSAYAAIEFPKNAQVTYIGEDRPTDATVNLSGDTMLPLSAQAIPPYPEATSSARR